MIYTYENWSPVIFMGFYESFLYNSDTEYYINENLKDEDEEHPEGYEIDFKTYTQEIAQKAVYILEEFCINDDKIIKSMNFKYLYSPRYYNYDTDRLNIEINVDLRKLKAFINHNKKDFNLYLKDNFTSYDGFTSYVENNFTAFKEQYKYDSARCINVMIEYYILHCIYDNSTWEEIKNLKDDYNTSYHYRLFGANDEIQYNNLIPIEPIEENNENEIAF